MSESLSESVKRLDEFNRATDLRLLERANREIIPAELLAEVIRQYAALPTVDHGLAWSQRYNCLMEILETRGLQYTHDLFTAIHDKVAALERLPPEALHGWSPEAGSSRESTHPDLIETAAAEPLILEDKRFPRVIFDAESFRHRLLEIAAKTKKA